MASDVDVDKIFGALDKDEQTKILERDKKMVECFRRVFSSDEGKIVLHQILLDLKFFDWNINSPQEIALNNYAKFMIYKRLGCNNDKQISDAIFDCRREI